MGLDYCDSALLTCLVVVPSFVSLVVEDLFCYIPVLLINSCSVNIGNFGVSMQGGELIDFLLHHLGHHSNRGNLIKEID